MQTATSTQCQNFHPGLSNLLGRRLRSRGIPLLHDDVRQRGRVVPRQLPARIPDVAQLKRRGSVNLTVGNAVSNDHDVLRCVIRVLNSRGKS